jgi:hypothetical protein
VHVVVDPSDNLVRASITPWPPPEIVQKLYASRQIRAFDGEDRDGAVSALGYYSDLQSLNSEDAITWSAFGPIVYADPATRARYIGALLSLLGIDSDVQSNVSVWLWRRVPHPDSLVSGGPEIDFGIQTKDVVVLGEAKWHSGFGVLQGVHKDKDQITLRREYCQLHGQRLYPTCTRFVVASISLAGAMLANEDVPIPSGTLSVRDLTWTTLCALTEHPHTEELQRYLRWKEKWSSKPATSSHSVDHPA